MYNNDVLKNLTMQAQKGDKNAFGKLYEEIGKSVYFNCLKLTGDEQLAKDILQETFLTAYEKLPQLKNLENINAWINRIAINKCKMSFRGYKQVDNSEEILDDIIDEDLQPDEYVYSEEEKKIIIDIIDNVLTPRQRQIVILYYYNRMSVLEISSIMDCPEGTVKSGLSLARKKIKEAVLNYEEKNNDRLHAVISIPILTNILNAQVQKLTLPKITFWDLPKIPSSKGFEKQTHMTKSGGRKMFNTLKSKIIAGTAAAAVVCGAITAAAVINNNNNDETSSKVRRDSSISESQTESSSEETSQKMLWLFQQDFSSGQQSSFPEDFTLFFEKVSVPISLSELDAYYYTDHKRDGDEDTYFGSVSAWVNSDEVIKAGSNDSNHCRWTFLFSKEEEHYGKAYMKMAIYNFSDQDMTAVDCYNNGWWSIHDFDDNGNYKEFEYFGYDEDDLEGDTRYEKNINCMEGIIEKLGSPNYIYSYFGVDSIKEKKYAVDELTQYTLAWAYEDYVLRIGVYDGIFYDENTFNINYAIYQPKDCWDWDNSDNENENIISELF